MSKAKTIQKIESKNLHSGMRHTVARILAWTIAISLFLFFEIILYLTYGEKPRRSVGEVITHENASAILDQAAESDNSPENTFEAVMNYTWMFDVGDMTSTNAYVENSPDNQRPFYFTVTLADPSRTVLYISPTLAVGDVSSAIKLNTLLPAGSYDATLTYYLLDDAANVVNTIEMKLQLVVGQ